MKKINLILRKCKSLSRQLGRSSSYSSLRSKSTKEDLWGGKEMKQEDHHHDQQHSQIIFVGSTRKRYVISSKYLKHPLLNALIDKSKPKGEVGDFDENALVVKCEVVLFDHLLWMLENTDPNLSSESLEELAELYVF
ncbi:Auxin responsive SAUR protein [Quillaja saponaria]|uniref:Auxin responsive SAUR protein n=1 Tax=Quillaja saponaria TaxID=32244 RepID=A0AAD7KZY9_QUISA|nr:Auxin responsive SAUR protein [Quillaja saponaria]KAJ7948906.1 Auxin responsive SAUR protein [Quillaja saponaria]